VRLPSPLSKRYRFPGEIISHAVWLSYRFLLSYRDVEELLAERGVAVSYETIRRWCQTFGHAFAEGVRWRRPRPGDMWHLHELVLKINGRKHWLWRAVDQEGMVLDILVRSRRNRKAAETFLRQVLAGCGIPPRVIVTDKLASYPPAIRHVRAGLDARRAPAEVGEVALDDGPDGFLVEQTAQLQPRDERWELRGDLTRFSVRRRHDWCSAGGP
jgi:putative transposase